jgi:hypothetical protein
MGTFMRLLPPIVTLSLLLIAATEAPVGAAQGSAAPGVSAEPRTVAEFAALCAADLPRCNRLTAVLLQTGVQAQKLPPCVGLLNMHDLTQQMLKWWAANPNQANNKLVLGVIDALAALKPC